MSKCIANKDQFFMTVMWVETNVETATNALQNIQNCYSRIRKICYSRINCFCRYDSTDSNLRVHW